MVGTAGAAPKPKPGGSVTLVSSSIVTQLDANIGNAGPSGTVEVPSYLAVYDALLTPDAVHGVAKPRIATSITSKDSTVWTLKLRSGVTFSDGTPLDANAIKTNWDRINGKATAPAKGNFANVASWSVTDPLTLTITLKGPSPDFPYLLSTWAQNYIISPAQIRTNEAGIARAPIGAGAYTIKEFVVNDHLTLTKNPNYYGTAYLDGITIRLITDESQRLATMQSGGADLLRTNAPSTIAAAKGAGIRFTDVVTGGGSVLQFNLSKPPFDDIRARQALAYVMNQKELDRVVFPNAEQPATTMFPRSSPYYVDTVMAPTPSDKKAQALFDELAAAGKPLNFALTTTDGQQFVQMAQWLQTKLAGFKNVTMKIDTRLGTTITAQVLVPSAFQAVLFPVFGVLPSEFGTYMQVGGGKNYGKISDSVLDSAITKATASPSTKVRVDAVRDIQAQILKTLPFVVYQRYANAVFVSKSVQGFKPFGLNAPDWPALWKTTS
jgi:peptide/nickel transport system substrate-binding protein